MLTPVLLGKRSFGREMPTAQSVVATPDMLRELATQLDLAKTLGVDSGYVKTADSIVTAVWPRHDDEA